MKCEYYEVLEKQKRVDDVKFLNANKLCPTSNKGARYDLAEFKKLATNIKKLRGTYLGYEVQRGVINGEIVYTAYSKAHRIIVKDKKRAIKAITIISILPVSLLAAIYSGFTGHMIAADGFAFVGIIGGAMSVAALIQLIKKTYGQGKGLYEFIRIDPDSKDVNTPAFSNVVQLMDFVHRQHLTG